MVPRTGRLLGVFGETWGEQGSYGEVQSCLLGGGRIITQNQRHLEVRNETSLELLGQVKDLGRRPLFSPSPSSPLLVKRDTETFLDLNITKQGMPR